MMELRLIYSSQAMFHPFAGNWYQDVGSIESRFENLSNYGRLLNQIK
jgi:hypothetical protein